MSNLHPRLDTNRVYFDTPGDGAIWARGAQYKASFAPERTQYIPFLGSSALQLYPVAIALQDIAVDGRSVAFTTGVSAERTGDTVVFDRGSVLETYQLTPGGMEQSFVFDSLPARGELVVRTTVDTELEGLETADGLRFSNELGYVSYSRAVAYDASGRTTPAATHLNGSSIEIRVPAEFLAGATLPVTVDPVVTTWGVGPSPDSSSSPDVAYGLACGDYFVVWEDDFGGGDHDVWAEAYSPAGAPVSPLFTVDFTTDRWSHPQVAANANSANFMTVAQVGAPGSGTRIIRGRITADCSWGQSAQFTVSTVGSDNFNPNIGSDPTLTPPTYYMVTWENTFGAADHDIYGQLVDPGTTANVGAIPIFVDFSTEDDENPGISKCDGQAPFATQRWTIAWQRDFAHGGVDHDIWGAQYLWDGSLVNSTYMIDFTGNDDHNPEPSSLLDDPASTRDYLVVYRELSGGSGDIVDSIYNETIPVSGPTNLSVAQDMGFEVQDQIHPAADSDGTNYAVVWSEQYLGSATDYDIYICTVDKNGKVADAHDNLDFSTAHSDNPQITSSYSGGGPKAGYNAAWDSDAAGGTILAGTYDKSPFTSFCYPAPGNFWDSAVACPCSNPPSSVGRGCNNSAGTGGAILTSTGVASLSGDTVMLTSSGEKPTAFSLFAQGTTPLFGGVVFGQGVRCVGGTLKRLYSHSAHSGVVSGGFGVPGDSLVHVRSAALGDVIAAGTARYYFVYYRDPTVLGGCPASSTFNCTQSGSLVWYP